MDGEAFRKIEPAEFYREFLDQKVRPDGRGFSAFRSPLISKSVIQKCHGSASLRCGKSFYVAAVHGEIHSENDPKLAKTIVHETSFPMLSERNQIIVNVQLPKTYGFEIKDELGPSFGISSYVSSTLNALLNSPMVLDTERLRLDNGASTWILYVNVFCVEYDGNYLDLPLLVVLAALENTELPLVYWDERYYWWRDATGYTSHTPLYESTVEGNYESQFSKSANARDSKLETLSQTIVKAEVRLLNRPFCITFANLFDTVWVADPCKEEEELGTLLSLHRLQGKWYASRLGGRELQLYATENMLRDTASTIMDGFASVLDNL